MSAHISFPLHCAGACWNCDEDVFVPVEKRQFASTFQMLFCCEECHTASMQEGTLYGTALVIHRKPAPEPAA